jgi:methyl-accepting chemotaxis protein
MRRLNLFAIVSRRGVAKCMDNRRKKIVINRDFQQHYAVITVVMTVLLTNIFIILRSLLPGDQPLELTSTAAWTIAIVELILIIGAWYGSLKATHKIAGPVFIFARQLKAVGAGDLWTRVSLRQKDMFQEEATAINASLEQLQGKVEAVQNAAEVLQQAQTDGADTGAAMVKLMTELAALRTVRES